MRSARSIGLPVLWRHRLVKLRRHRSAVIHLGSATLVVLRPVGLVKLRRHWLTLAHLWARTLVALRRHRLAKLAARLAELPLPPIPTECLLRLEAAHVLTAWLIPLGLRITAKLALLLPVTRALHLTLAFRTRAVAIASGIVGSRSATFRFHTRRTLCAAFSFNAATTFRLTRWAELIRRDLPVAIAIQLAQSVDLRRIDAAIVIGVELAKHSGIRALRCRVRAAFSTRSVARRAFGIGPVLGRQCEAGDDERHGSDECFICVHSIGF